MSGCKWVLIVALLVSGWFSGVSADDLAVREWHDFRGPKGDGHAVASEHTIPLAWGEGTNVSWRTKIHGRGWSSPVVADGRVWVTTATRDGRSLSVLALDVNTGEVLIDRVVFTVAKPEPLGNGVNGYASPSPVYRDGKVIVHFGSPGTACLDAKTGETLWKRRDLPCRHYRGPGSSPVVHDGLVILTMDGIDVQYLVAIKLSDGTTVWKTDRTTDFKDLGKNGKPMREGDQRKAYSTALITEASGEDIIVSAGAKAAYAYRFKDGEELWRIEHGGYSCAARPVVAGELAVINTGYPKPELLAVRLGSRGRIARADLVWTYAKAVSKRSSPLVIDGLLYMVSDEGIATCLSAESGAEVWKHRLNGRFSASPIYVDGHLIFFDEAGGATVMKPGKAAQPVSVNRLSAGCMGSPAVYGSSLIVRTKQSVLRLTGD